MVDTFLGFLGEIGFTHRVIANSTAALLGYGTAHVDGIVQLSVQGLLMGGVGFHAASNICANISENIRTCLHTNQLPAFDTLRFLSKFPLEEISAFG